MISTMLPVCIIGLKLTQKKLNHLNGLVLCEDRSLNSEACYVLKHEFKYITELPLLTAFVGEMSNSNTEEEEAIIKAETIFRAAKDKFPNSSTTSLFQYEFLENVKNNKESAKYLLEEARRRNPSLSERYFIFTKLQVGKSENSNEAGMDVAKYIKFQQMYKVIVKAHKKTLASIKSFWKLIYSNNEPALESMTKCFTRIDASESECSKLYMNALNKFPRNVQLIRSYAEFLAGVQNDISKAKKFFIEADRLEEQSEQSRRDTSNLSGDGEGIDDKNDAIVVINEYGIIMTANANIKHLFGYSESEIINKNVSMLMPAPFKQQHNGYLSKYKVTFWILFFFFLSIE